MTDDAELATRAAPALEAAAIVVMERLAVKASDTVSIICNPDRAETPELVAVVADAARERTCRVGVCEYPTGKRDGQEPPAAVASAMYQATVLVLLTHFSLSHTTARMQATRLGARIASMPAITRETFARSLPANYDELRRVGQRLAGRLTAAASCRVTGPGGTDLVLSLDGRTAICDDGDLRAPGAFGNLPAGEAYIAPRESDANGTIVFDGSLSEWGVLDGPLTVVVERGRTVSFDGGAAAQWLLETLDAGGPNGRVIAELGIGTNPGAVVTGLVLEDEKATGTAHFAFGNNSTMGGENVASIHLDALVLDPRIELDGVVILDRGLPVI